MRSSGDINVNVALEIECIKEDLDGSIAALCGEFMFPSRIVAEDDGIADDAECAELGCDSEQNVLRALGMCIEKTIKQGFPR